MRPLAIIPVYNEADILPAVLRHLEREGCDVYLLDNWSTDRHMIHSWTFNETWPDHEPTFYDWTGILKRVEEIALEHGRRRWCILHDADEIRRSWHCDTTLSEGLRFAGRFGYNAAKFEVRHYVPVDDSWKPGGDPEEHFRYYRPDHVDYRNSQIKAWIQGDERVDLHTHAGHEVVFSSRGVFPYSFLIKHYPIRSQEHGERKMRERRYSPEERAKGWHVQYDHWRGQLKPNFIEKPENLCFDTGTPKA